MRRFISRLFLFILPVGVVIVPLVAVLHRSGEFLAFDVVSVIQRQKNNAHTSLYGPAFTDCSATYKLAAARARSASVMVLGTSRVLQFRADFFGSEAAFFNAGLGVAKLRHFRQFLEELPAGQRPSLLLVGLDQYFFNAHWDDFSNDDYLSRLGYCNNYLAVVQAGLRGLGGDLLAGRRSLGPLLTARASGFVGLNAILNQEGFRKDGSYRYGRMLADPASTADLHFQDTFRRIATGTMRFEPGEEVSTASLTELEQLLELTDRLRIHVIAFIPPFAPAVLDRIRVTGKYGYLEKIMPSIAPTFARHGASLFDFTDARALKARDEHFFDGFHGSERVYLRMLLEMAARDRQLAQAIKPAVELERLEHEGSQPLLVSGLPP